MSSIVYKSYLGENNMPKVSHFGISLNKYFTKEYYERRLPVWQDLDEWSSLGSPGERVGLEDKAQTSLIYGVIGLLIGLFLYWIFSKREYPKQASLGMFSRMKGNRGGNQ